MLICVPIVYFCVIQDQCDCNIEIDIKLMPDLFYSSGRCLCIRNLNQTVGESVSEEINEIKVIHRTQE